MAKSESEFQKMLGEAPMAPNADTVTVVGMLGRTADAARFALTLPDGRTETLDVDAVKSAKAIAGAIGQSVVQLELDAKRVPESLRWFKSGPDHTGVAADTQFGPWGPLHGGGVSPPKERIETLAAGGLAQHAPFVAASPHQADPATMHALAFYGGFGSRTYFTAYDWTTDHHTVLKPFADTQ